MLSPEVNVLLKKIEGLQASLKHVSQRQDYDNGRLAAFREVEIYIKEGLEDAMKQESPPEVGSDD